MSSELSSEMTPPRKLHVILTPPGLCPWSLTCRWAGHRLPSRGSRSAEDQAAAFSPSFTHALSTREWSDKIPDPEELPVRPPGWTPLI